MQNDFETVIKCQYPDCKSVAKFDIYDQQETDHILVCKRCKYIVHANLDRYRCFVSPEAKRKDMQKKPIKEPKSSRSVAPIVPTDWMKEAARKAEMNARELKD